MVYCTPFNIAVGDSMSDLWWPKFLRKPRIILRTPRIGEVRMPSKWIFFAIIICAYYFIVSGSIHTLTYQPGPIGGIRHPLLADSLHRQLLIEGFVGGAFYFVGFLGFYFIFHSTRHVYRPRYSQMMLAMGWACVFISFIGCQTLIAIKLGLITLQ